MKRSILSLAIVLLCFISSQVNAQAFDSHTSMFSVGAGMTNSPVLMGAIHREHPENMRLSFTPLRPQFTFKGEFAVHKYWGVGFTTSVDGGHYQAVQFVNAPYDQINMQVGALANFHFYQLIADRMNNNPKLHADKLDIYTGISLGYILTVNMQPGYTNYQHGIMADYHVGVRYNVTKRFSVYGEVGYGQSIINLGASFKIGVPKAQKPIKQF